jgi:hypothetical protein
MERGTEYIYTWWASVMESSEFQMETVSSSTTRY